MGLSTGGSPRIPVLNGTAAARGTYAAMIQGDLWVDTDGTKHLYTYNGAAWVDVLAGVTTKGVNAIGTSIATATFTSNSNTYVDVTNPATLTLATTKTCTIVAFARFCHNSTLTNNYAYRVMIDGTASPSTLSSCISSYQESFCMGIKTGVVSGNKDIKLQVRSQDSSNLQMQYNVVGVDPVAQIIAVALEE
jgi:hypothetical protein